MTYARTGFAGRFFLVIESEELGGQASFNADQNLTAVGLQGLTHEVLAFGRGLVRNRESIDQTLQLNTRKRNKDGTFGHTRIPKGSYRIYEFKKVSEGEEAQVGYWKSISKGPTRVLNIKIRSFLPTETNGNLRQAGVV